MLQICPFAAYGLYYRECERTYTHRHTHTCKLASQYARKNAFTARKMEDEIIIIKVRKTTGACQKAKNIESLNYFNPAVVTLRKCQKLRKRAHDRERRAPLSYMADGALASESPRRSRGRCQDCVHGPQDDRPEEAQRGLPPRPVANDLLSKFPTDK